MDARARIALTAGPRDREFGSFLAALECHLIDIAITANGDIEALRQGVNHRHADPVQTATELVVFRGELATRVQGTQDHFNARLVLNRVHINRHAASVVDHPNTAIRMKRDINLIRISPKGFVNTVVDDFLG